MSSLFSQNKAITSPFNLLMNAARCISPGFTAAHQVAAWPRVPPRQPLVSSVAATWAMHFPDAQGRGGGQIEAKGGHGR